MTYMERFESHGGQIVEFADGSIHFDIEVNGVRRTSQIVLCPRGVEVSAIELACQSLLEQGGLVQIGEGRQ